jgi:biopolymer transport protein ExbD
MAGAAPIPSKGQKRALDAALNLVPFIDLLSCCIAFLLITAVWTSLATLPASRRGEPDGVETIEQRTSLALLVDSDGYTISRSTGENDFIPLRAGAHDRLRLAERLQAARQALPAVDELTVRPADPVPYDEIIGAMDAAKAARYDRVAVEGRE